MTLAAAGRPQMKSKEKTHDLSSSALPPRLLVVHDAIWRREDQVPELPRRKDVGCKLVDCTKRHVEARRNDTALVDAADEVDHHLPSAMVVDDFKVADISVLLHHLQELDDNLRVWPHEGLALATFLGVANVVEAISEYTDLDHDAKGGMGGDEKTNNVQVQVQNKSVA